MAYRNGYKSEFLIFHMQKGSSLHAAKKKREDHQHFFCVGECGRFYGSGVFGIQGGMNAFTKALAKELAPSNIQVNAIACGVIDTEMNHGFNEEERAALCEEIPADRFGQTTEVAALVMQLIQGNEYLTGQIITLDGGWT